MKLEKMIRDLSLRAIVLLVILIGLWAIVLMVGATFNWSFLTGKIETAFYLGGFLVGLLILALSFASGTASLAIISKAQNRETGGSRWSRKQVALLVAVPLALVLVLVGGLWYAEWRVYRTVSEEAWNKVRVLAEKSQLGEMAGEIREDGEIANILALRDALAADISSEGRVSFLVPRDRAGVKVYYELTPWFQDDKEEEKTFSEADLNRFRPSGREKDDFDRMARGELDSFQVPLKARQLRVFLAREFEGQEIVILLDTSRQLSDYRSGFK